MVVLGIASGASLRWEYSEDTQPGFGCISYKLGGVFGSRWM